MLTKPNLICRSRILCNQIQGRFRKDLNIGKNYNSLTHIANWDYQGILQPKTPDHLDVEIEEYRLTHSAFQQRLKGATNPAAKEAINKDMFKSSYAALLNEEDGNLNEFAVNHLYNEERVKNYYKEHDSLLQAYPGF